MRHGPRPPPPQVASVSPAPHIAGTPPGRGAAGRGWRGRGPWGCSSAWPPPHRSPSAPPAATGCWRRGRSVTVAPGAPAASPPPAPWPRGPPVGGGPAATSPPAPSGGPGPCAGGPGGPATCRSTARGPRGPVRGTVTGGRGWSVVGRGASATGGSVPAVGPAVGCCGGLRLYQAPQLAMMGGLIRVGSYSAPTMAPQPSTTAWGAWPISPATAPPGAPPTALVWY